MASSATTTIEFLADGGSNGTTIGRSTSKLYFWGSTGDTPVTVSTLAHGPVETTEPVSSGVAHVAFSSASQFSTLINTVNEIRAALVRCGIVK